MDASLLLPRKQYAEEHTKHGEVPFMFEIENDKQSLFYFGANHSRDPQNVQYPILKKYWEEFMQSTEGRSRIVLIEGGLRQVASSESEAIKKGAEADFATFLAHKAGIPVDCPDIRDNDRLMLLQSTPIEHTLLYWFVVFADNWRRQADPKPDFEEYISSRFDAQRKRNMWKGEDLSFKRVVKLYEELIGKEFVQDDNFNDLTNPNKTGAITNDVARAQSDLRDLRIASEIERHWDEGKSIFAIFGSGHLIIQEPALKKVLQ